jgi:hypothetical protein
MPFCALEIWGIQCINEKNLPILLFHKGTRIRKILRKNGRAKKNLMRRLGVSI